jgi:hypothetical protein
MPTFSETGHAKNIANFQTLITFIDGYGATYNPSNNALKLPALNTLLLEAQTKLNEVTAKNTNFNSAVNNRMQEFSTLKPLATRVINSLQTTEASLEIINDAKTFNRKLQGKRAAQPAAASNPNAPAPNTISASQQSYDQQIQHLAGLITVLQSEPSYTPNEPDLTIANLSAKQITLAAKNAAVATAYAVVSNARIARNNTLYNTETGVVQTAAEIKKYIKSVFGASSPEYNQVKGIEFNKIKI